MHAETTFGARRADRGPSGRFVLEIDRAGVLVRLFHDPPQFLLVEGCASRADVVDGRFTFVGECQFGSGWRKQCKNATWLLFSPL